MFNKNLLAIATGAALLVGAQGASAGMTGPAVMMMDVQISDTCAMSAISQPIGPVLSNSGDVGGLLAGNISVTCAPGINYRIMVDGGMNGFGVRNMADWNTGAMMAYELFDMATGAPVGDMNPIDPGYMPMYMPAFWAPGIDGFGTGATNNHQLMATVHSAGMPAGNYHDEVAVTVTF
ncbi:MAG TPA: spore coat protein U domain-containing protein [Gammaproteobacteria bacterium]